VETLRILSRRLISPNPDNISQGDEIISDLVLQRSCRTGSGSDSFFVVEKLLCTPDTFVTQRTEVSDPPVQIDLFKGFSESHTSVYNDAEIICCRIEVTNMFSIYDLSVMDGLTGDPKVYLQ